MVWHMRGEMRESLLEPAICRGAASITELGRAGLQYFQFEYNGQRRTLQSGLGRSTVTP